MVHNPKKMLPVLCSYKARIYNKYQVKPKLDAKQIKLQNQTIRCNQSAAVSRV